jgi:hypothetical protein
MGQFLSKQRTAQALADLFGSTPWSSVIPCGARKAMAALRVIDGLRGVAVHDA